MKLTIPDLSLVVLIGPSGAGKSTFARRHFAETEVLSSDRMRALVSDDENNQEATGDAFQVLLSIAARRLARGRLTVIDATNVQPEARKPYVELARQYHGFAVAIVLALPDSVCHERNRSRPDRAFGPHVVRGHVAQMRRSLRDLQREGFRYVYVLRDAAEVEAAQVERARLWTDKRDEHGPFDLIGDVHGCHAELRVLLERLGYQVDGDVIRHPQGRKAVFLGDLVDRGPGIAGVLRLVMESVAAGTALCVPGNHEAKLLRRMQKGTGNVSHGMAQTLEQLEREPPEFARRVERFLDALVSHYVLDDGRLVVAHAGLKEAMHGRGSGRVRQFALYGDTTGETDEYGLPVRYPWATEYRGKALVVYGHTPVPEPEWLNNTICIDTGCVFGGHLTALRYPERELVSVPAEREYYAPKRPLAPARPAPLTAQQEHDTLLDLSDVLGKRIVSTGLGRTVTVREENATAALEVMSRFAADPRWLVYLPPTMSPAETSTEPGLLEHPRQALEYYAREGVERVVCEEKHMGSRAVLVVCRDADAARRRFGVDDGSLGAGVSRTGRRFFTDAAIEAEVLARAAAALERTALWAELESDWVVLDAEVMPWSMKAQDLLRDQYAATGTAARHALEAAHEVLWAAEARGAAPPDLAARMAERRDLADRFVAAYRRYCWPVSGIGDVRVAPFHLLASDGRVHIDRDHLWHMTTLARLAAADPDLFQATRHEVADPRTEEGQAAATQWWQALVDGGGEGMVVKPLQFVARGRRGLVQPAIKCRGPEYLRIIYGLDYTLPEYLDRLRARGVSGKRSLALREFALGIEALERFVAREPLRRVHECVFGVLALESEPVDPRL